MSHTHGPRPMGPRRALPTPPTRDDYRPVNPPPEMIAALGPPPSAIETRPPFPLPTPTPFLNVNGAPSATPIPSPAPSPGLPPSVPFQAPPPPPPLPSQGAPTPSEMMRSSRVGLYANQSSRPQLSLGGLSGSTPPPQPVQKATAPLNIRARPRVEVPRHSIPSDIDSADADDERVTRMTMNRSRPSYSSNLAPGPVIDERSPLPQAPPQSISTPPAIPIEASPSPGPMIGRIGGGGAGRPKLGLRTSSGSALPDDDAPAPAPAPPPLDSSASLTSLRPKLQLPGTNPNPNPSRPKLGLSLGGGSSGPAKSAPSLKLDLSAARGADSDDDADYSYYGFKPTSRRQNSIPAQSLLGGSESFPSDSSQATLQPPSTTTAKPFGPNVTLGRTDDGLADVRRAINELRMPELEEELEAREKTGTGASSGDEWSDDVLEVLARLGEGAGGAVSKVRDKRNGRVMARKTIPTGTVPARQLLRELHFSKLVHPNLIVCYGAYISSPPEDESGRSKQESNYTPEIHILMELCEGGALDSIARQMKTRHANVRIGEKVIARLAEGVLKGLDYMHANKVIHRDIKPSNILVTRTGVVKLIDFGVSGDLEASLASTFTGTSWYMAPERITGHAYSIRADVWSTGLTFLELAQNRFPYPPDLGPIELLTYIVNGEVPELDDEPGDENGNGAIHWSDGMKSFIKLSLRLDAASRPTPREMLQHPWIQESMARKLDMSKWIREVWGWEKPAKAKRSSQASQ